MGTALREILKIVVLALIIFLVANATLATNVVVMSSMEPSLYEGQCLLVNKVAYLSHDPDRGDVIVFYPPYSPGEIYIKRVIGIPGDTIEITDGKVYINGEPIYEPYIMEEPHYSTTEPIVVGDNEYFVLGDNRNHSSDSYDWGTVPLENIIGKAWISYWPISEWGMAPNYPIEVGGD